MKIEEINGLDYAIRLTQYLLQRSKAKQIGEEPTERQKGFDEALEIVMQDLILKVNSLREADEGRKE